MTNTFLSIIGYYFLKNYFLKKCGFIVGGSADIKILFSDYVKIFSIDEVDLRKSNKHYGRYGEAMIIMECDKNLKDVKIFSSLLHYMIWYNIVYNIVNSLIIWSMYTLLYQYNVDLEPENTLEIIFTLLFIAGIFLINAVLITGEEFQYVYALCSIRNKIKIYRNKEDFIDFIYMI
jgi:hypothetical protein